MKEREKMKKKNIFRKLILINFMFMLVFVLFAFQANSVKAAGGEYLTQVDFEEYDDEYQYFLSCKYLFDDIGFIHFENDDEIYGDWRFTLSSKYILDYTLFNYDYNYTVFEIINLIYSEHEHEYFEIWFLYYPSVGKILPYITLDVDQYNILDDNVYKVMEIEFIEDHYHYILLNEDGMYFIEIEPESNYGNIYIERDGYTVPWDIANLKVGDRLTNISFHNESDPAILLKNIEDMNPVINGETAFITSYDNPVSLDDILFGIMAYDNEDGDITHLINVDANNYDPEDEEFALGEYIIELSVEDSSGNVAFLTVHVFVKDITSPVISGKKTYSQSYTEKLNVETVLNALSVSDNYDVDLVITIKENNYTSNYSQLGAKTIVFKAVDSSENETEYIVTINVIDDVVPVFTGPTSIMKGQEQILSLQSILAQISVNDIKDPEVEFSVVSDNYTGKGNMLGEYQIKLKAEDASGNIAYHVITINVVDDIPPVFYVDNFFINVEDVVHLSRQDIIDILMASGQISGGGIMSVSFVIDDYTDNEDVPGIYPMAVSYDSSNGSGGLVSFAIQVLSTAEEDEDPIIIEEPELSFWKKITKPFVDVWDWLNKPVVEDGNFVYGYFVAIGFVLLIVGGLLLFKPTKRNYRGRGRYHR